MRFPLPKIKSLPSFVCTTFLLSLSCTVHKSNHNISPVAEKYLTEVLTLLQEKSINKHNINWNSFKKKVFLFSQNCQTIEDTYPAIEYAVKQLKDNHTYFISSKQNAQTTSNKPLPTQIDEITPSDIGYIKLSFCIGNETNTYIKSVANKIAEQNHKAIKGWILDLRDNFGGNMWPMMAAVGSLLDTGVQGYFCDADNTFSEWRYVDGKVYMDTSMLSENKIIVSLYGKSKIAVLISHQTASSGEAMAVLFKGYSNAKFFGNKTYGVSTGCASFTFSDNSRINLATTVFVDRNQKKYGGHILPDFPCSDKESFGNAINWIYKQ